MHVGKLAKILQKNLIFRSDELRLSQNALSKLSGIPQAHISRMFNKPMSVSVNTLEKLAKALKVPAYKLLMEDQELELSPEDAIRVIKKSLGLK